MPSYVTDAKLDSAQLALCGAMAGVVSRMVIAPLDVVKIRMQLQTHRTQFGLGSRQASTAGQVKYAHIWRSLQTILREEGVRGLYRGNVPAECLYLSYSAVEFWAYKELEVVIDRLDAKQQWPHASKTFLSGMAAGSMATALTYPFDLLRTRFTMAGRNKHYTSLAKATKHIYEHEGLRGFYPGMWTALIQIMPYMGLLFASYDAVAASFKRLRDDHTLSARYKPVHDMISGALSGIFSKTAVYPMDVVRKRLQVQGPSLAYCAAQPRHVSVQMSWLACLRHVAQHEGVSSLYKGLAPSLVKVAPANAVTFVVFEESKKWLLHFTEGQEEENAGF